MERLTYKTKQHWKFLRHDLCVVGILLWEKLRHLTDLTSIFKGEVMYYFSEKHRFSKGKDYVLKKICVVLWWLGKKLDCYMKWTG